jgi:prepilin-type N-terminal cleavage/methylation domain-containing protein
MRAWTRGDRERGLTLVEVLIATTLFTVVTLAAAHLLVWAVRALWSTGAQTTALAAAQARLEELQALAWRFDDAGNRISDFDTNLSTQPAAGGGPGLSTSPPNALLASLDGYADYLDADGRWVGGGTRPPPGAVFVRRWAVRPLITTGGTEDTLVLQVLVVPLANQPNDRFHLVGRPGGESLLTTARTRVR